MVAADGRGLIVVSGAVCCALVDDHPGCAELVAEHAEAVGEEGLCHGHEDGAAVGEQGVEPLGLVVTVDVEGEIGAAHGFEVRGRDVAGHDFGVADDDAGVEDGIFHFSWSVGLGRFAVCEHGCDLSAEMLFVKTEGLGAVAAIVEVGAKLHRPCCLLLGCERRVNGEDGYMADHPG
jgi:hypothetical protein